MNYAGQINWSELSRLNFIYEDKCWESCAADCCQSELPGANFKFIKNPGTWIFYLPGEYRYFNEMGLLPHLDKASSALREVRLELSNGVTISGLWFQCRYEGLCGGHIGKPLLCKLVPFLPVMDMNGTLVDLAMINLLDITISVMGLEPRCSVLKLKDKYLELWSKNPELIQPLRQPYILFYLLAAAEIIEIYKEGLVNHPNLSEKKGASFWHAWEIEYVTGRLFNKEKARERLLQLYNEFTDKYADFSLDG